MAYRGESWEEVVSRAASAQPRRARGLPLRESAEELAARSEPWKITTPGIELDRDALTLGAGLTSVVVDLFQVYHLEPIDPWPSVAVGWVERGAAYRSIVTPRERDAEEFAAVVEEVVEACERSAPRAVSRGWLAVPDVPWERTDALPREKEEGPMMRGYRLRPGVPDPVLATREIAAGEARLWTFVAARLRRPPHRVEPRTIVLTERYLYVRTIAGRALRIPADTLRDGRYDADGDAVYVFGRRTELLVVHDGACPLTPILRSRVGRREAP